MLKIQAALLIVALLPLSVYAQGRGGAAQVPRTSKEAAPIDITGYWVSIVTEDWRYRMITPRKGDYQGIPLNAEARKVADGWDPAKDEASGEQCRSYGAANLMRLPGRIRITWHDDETLKLEADAGSQTRLFHFGASENQGGDWQGISKASWDMIPGGRGQPPIGSLKVVTTKLRPGYLRKNGVPYGASTTLTEYFDRVSEPSGDSNLVITTTVEDPVYLTQPYLTSTHFKKQADASGWNPSPCASQ